MSAVSSRRFRADALERVFWTTLEFGAGLGITETTPLDTWWAAPIGVGLALLKALAAKRIGQRGTASTLSAVSDPAGSVAPVIPPSR